jgi:hypothetical protein
MTIEDIKTELREIIELSDEATPGPWNSREKFKHSFELFEPRIWLGGSSSLPPGQQKHNAAFCATSRNLTPKIARALLTAIYNLELIHESSPMGKYAAWDALETIRREWEVQV